jgi:hypothetical protein
VPHLCATAGPHTPTRVVHAGQRLPPIRANHDSVREHTQFRCPRRNRASSAGPPHIDTCTQQSQRQPRHSRPPTAQSRQHPEGRRDRRRHHQSLTSRAGSQPGYADYPGRYSPTPKPVQRGPVGAPPSAQVSGHATNQALERGLMHYSAGTGWRRRQHQTRPAAMPEPICRNTQPDIEGIETYRSSRHGRSCDGCRNTQPDIEGIETASLDGAAVVLAEVATPSPTSRA